MEASALRAPAGLTRLSLPSALLKLRSDEQLVALFRAGNDEAFRVIHDRYRQRLFAYVRQMLAGSRSDSEDAMQDVFLRAYNALRADDRPVALKAWLYRVAHNRCIDQLRRPVPAPADVFDISRTPVHDPLAEAERRDDLRRLVADVRELPEQQRSALLMRELEGLSYADLAEALDVSVPAIKSLLVRARIGLVEQAEARDTACVDIRNDLALSFGKGVRASAKARRHMKECDGCRTYKVELRAVQQGLNSLTPSAPLLSSIAKLIGLGGAGGGAAAGAGGGAVGGGAAILGGAAATTTAKVAAIVCCAALTAGGAVEIKKHAIPGAAKDKPAAAERTQSTIVPEKLIAPTPLRDHRGSSPATAPRARAAGSGGAGAAATQRRAKDGVAAAQGAGADEAITPHASMAPPPVTKHKAQTSTSGAATTTDSTKTQTPATGTGTEQPATADPVETIVGSSTSGSSGAASGSGSGGGTTPPTASTASSGSGSSGGGASGSSSGASSGGQ